MEKLRIGTMVWGEDALNVIPQILPHGFECFDVAFWLTTGNTDLMETAKRLKENFSGKGCYGFLSFDIR